MAQYDGSIRINTQLNTNKFERSAKGLISGMEKLGNRLRGIVGSLGFAIGVASLVSLGKQAIDTASDIEEVQNVVDTAFGSMSYKMEEFAKTSVKQFGISQLSAKQLGSTFMAMGKSMVGDIEKASNMAIDLTARSADMASFYNKSVEETSTALKSIYTGETETLKAYGVVMTQVNLQEFARQQGINKSIQKMTQAEQVQLRYNYVMQQTAIAAGDFSKTSGSWANQTRILSEQFKELLSVLGSGLITVLTPVIKFLNTVLTQLIAISKQIGAILSKLFGISIPVADASKSTSSMPDNTRDLSDDMDSASKSAGDLAKGVKKAKKEAKKALAPFDRLNVLSNEAASGSGTGSKVAGGITKMPEVKMSTDKTESGLDKILEKIQPIINKLKELAGISFQGLLKGLGDWKTRFDSIKKSIDSIAKSLLEIFTDPKVISSANKYVKSVARLFGTLVGSLASVGLTIATNIVGGIAKYLRQSKDRIKKYLINMFNIWSEINNLFSELFESIAFVFEAFASEQGQQFTSNVIGIFTSAFGGITTLVSKIFRDIAGIIIKPFVENKEAFRAALEGFLGVLSSVTGTIKHGIQDTFDKLNKVYDTHFKPLFDSIANGLSSITGKLLGFWNTQVQPMLENMANGFDDLWKNHIQPLLNKAANLLGKVTDMLKALWENWIQPLVEWIIENVLPKILPVIETLWNGLKTVVGNIADALGGIIDALGGVIDFLTGVFSGNWEKAWNGIKTFFVGIWTAIKNIVKAAINVVKTVVSAALQVIKSIWSVAWTTIKTIASKVWNAIKSVIATAINAIKSVISTVLNAIKSVWSSVWNGIKLVASTIWNGIKNTISTVINGIKTGISTALNAIKSIWDKIWNGLSTTVTNIFGGIWGFIKGVINSILGGIESMANGVIKGINFIIRALNNLSFDIPDWVPELGGSSFGFDIKELSKVEIPKLASGAVIRGGNPFLAVLGDQPRGQTNIETPLPTMVNAFKQAISEIGGSDGDIAVRVYLGEKDITKAVKTEADTYFKRTGKELFVH